MSEFEIISDTTEIVKAEPVELARREPARSLLDVIADAATDPRVDVEKMERLLAMQQTIMKDQREQAFMAAMAHLTPKLPEIGKHGKSHHGKYARLEDIDRVIRPLLGEEGLSLSFDSLMAEGKVRVICKLSHSAGHSESKQVDLPIDNSGAKNPTQAIGSTVAYGRRILTKMFFNLIEGGEDTDGNDPTLITQEQAAKIISLIAEVKASKVKFLDHMKAEKVEAILGRDYQKAINALETRRRTNAHP